MNLRAFHGWFLVSAGALLCAVVVWLPAAGALDSLAARGAWGASILALMGLLAYARGRRGARRVAVSGEAP